MSIIGYFVAWFQIVGATIDLAGQSSIAAQVSVPISCDKHESKKSTKITTKAKRRELVDD